jgi:hypothetical protein
VSAPGRGLVVDEAVPVGEEVFWHSTWLHWWVGEERAAVAGLLGLNV